MSVQVGKPAPSFSLYDSEKKKVSLEDFKGKNVLLLFFPQAFTGTCTKELCSMRDNIALYDQVNAQVLGISVDSLFTLARYKDDQQLNFPLLSDFNKEVIPKYGVLNPDMIGMKNIAKRAVFVIDRNGVVRHREVLEDARNEPNYNDINKALASL